MDIVLLVSHPCASCEAAIRLWREVTAAMQVPLTVRDIDDPLSAAGTPAAPTASLPLLLVDGKPLVVGVPEAGVARRLLRDALAARG